MSTKSKALIGLVGLVLSPAILYYVNVVGAGVGQMAENITTGRLPAPIPRPPKLLRESKIYGPLVRPGDVVAQGQEREYESYQKTGKHPMAMFPLAGVIESQK